MTQRHITTIRGVPGTDVCIEAVGFQAGSHIRPREELTHGVPPREVSDAQQIHSGKHGESLNPVRVQLRLQAS